MVLFSIHARNLAENEARSAYISERRISAEWHHHAKTPE
jgi:hypothetical protein